MPGTRRDLRHGRDDRLERQCQINIVSQNFAESFVISPNDHDIRQLADARKRSLRRALRNLAGAIRNGKETAVKWEEVITQLELIELAHTSSKTGRTINLSPS